MITTEQFWMGRDKQYPEEFTDTIRANGEETIRKVNNLLAMADKENIPYGGVASGWRPQKVNDATANSAGHSTHISALACDIRDTTSRSLAYWLVRNQNRLVLCELWCEDFRWTGGKGIRPWVHFQTVPPMSNNRVYIPSSKPATDPDFFTGDKNARSNPDSA